MQFSMRLAGIVVAALLLVGSTFMDWYVIVVQTEWGAMLGPMAALQPGGGGARVSTPPWSQHAPLAGILVAFACAAVVFAWLGAAEKLPRRGAAAGAAVCALGTVAVLIAQLTQTRTQDMFGVHVQISYTTGLFVAAAAAAALLVATAVNLAVEGLQELPSGGVEGSEGNAAGGAP